MTPVSSVHLSYYPKDTTMEKYSWDHFISMGKRYNNNTT